MGVELMCQWDSKCTQSSNYMNKYALSTYVHEHKLERDNCELKCGAYCCAHTIKNSTTLPDKSKEQLDLHPKL